MARSSGKCWVNPFDFLLEFFDVARKANQSCTKDFPLLCLYKYNVESTKELPVPTSIVLDS